MVVLIVILNLTHGTMTSQYGSSADCLIVQKNYEVLDKRYNENTRVDCIGMGRFLKDL